MKIQKILSNSILRCELNEGEEYDIKNHKNYKKFSWMRYININSYFIKIN